MTPNDSPPRMSAENPLDDLSERIRAAQEAAERIVSEAAKVPPRGYAAPSDRRAGESDTLALAALLDLGRTILPPELREQLAALVRELLLLIRAVIDWYLERVEERRKTPVEVEDIPIS